MRLNRLVFVLAIGLLLAGCNKAQVSEMLVGEKVGEVQKQMVVDDDHDGDEKMMGEGDQVNEVGQVSVDYTKATYDAARAAGKKILLYFEANWCPTCRAQKPVNEKVFSEYAGRGDVAIFVANFNDSDESNEDKVLAREFNVGYQHTFIFINSDGSEAQRSTGAMTEEEIVSKLEALN